MLSRAGVTTSDLTSFGLFVTGSNEKYSYTNVYMEKGENVWNAYTAADKGTQQLMLWYSASTPVTMIAYSPYNAAATATSVLACAVATDQSDGGSSSDFLYASSSVTPSNPVVTNNIYYDTDMEKVMVRMNHKLSRMHVNLKYGTELTKNGRFG